MREKLFYGPDSNNFGYLTLPESNEDTPMVVLIHGGFYRSKVTLDYLCEFAGALSENGVASWNIEYRRVGDSGGGWPGTFEDCLAACNFLKKIAADYPINSSDIIAIGHSAGAHIAIWIAAKSQVSEKDSGGFRNSPQSLSGVIGLAGVYDLFAMYEVHNTREKATGVENNPVRDLLEGTPEEVPARYNAASPTNLLPIGVPLMLLHGSLDINVPVGISRNFSELAREAGDDVDYIELPSMEHFKLTQPSAGCWKTITWAIQKLTDSKPGN